MMTRPIRFARLVLFAAILSGATISFAQTPAPKADSEGFVPVSPNEQLAVSEVLPASRLVATAYGFILAALVVWVGSVAARSRKVELELVALRQKIEK
jgi:hypothetical protein